MDQQLLHLVEHLGYLIVFLGVGIESLGVPVPGETALIIGAVLAAQGHLNPAGVAAAGLSGAVLGDNTGYLVGHRWGQRLISARGIRNVYDPRRVAVAERFFERHGWTAVFFGRFVAILRIFAGPLAGLHHMPWTHFLLANAAGGVIWVAAVVTAGLLVGGNLDHLIQLVSRAGYVGLAGVVVLGAVLYGVHRLRRRREMREGERLLQQRSAEERVTD
ncbi:MAG TPA: DedA family protein [Candidatus Dormibacteraeota bacterium]|nr:DedA family protein [Candidatus Dormibacteraeota bacterium]